MLPRMLGYGMFMDGLTYSSISRNLAEGFGSFWKPCYTETVYKTFYEHPPFGFLLQSFAFKIFGEALYVEAFYGFVIGLIIIGLIAAIWLAVRKNEVIAGVWWPIFLFVSLPMASWVLANNMLENTMAVFVLLAVLLAILSIRSAVIIKTPIYGFLSGVSIFLAFLTKGPSGMFPMVIPFIWVFVFRDTTFKKALISTLSIVSGIIIGVLVIVLPNSDAIAFFEVYFTNQVFKSLAGRREMASPHFAILRRLFFESLVPLSFCIIVYLVKRVRFNLRANKKLFFFILVSISGSLPLLISPKQRSWYLFPSLPLYSLAFAALFENSVKLNEAFFLKNRKLNTLFYFISSVILITAITWMFAVKGVIKRDKNFHKDFSLQEYNIPERITMSTYPSQLATNWDLVANMQREFKVSLSDTVGHTYLISTVEYSEADTLKNSYKKIHPPKPSAFILYKKIK
jgi:4-amino-4-deoxy-L-arabinose transferase-like glycosyltransferase